MVVVALLSVYLVESVYVVSVELVVNCTLSQLTPIAAQENGYSWRVVAIPLLVTLCNSPTLWTQP